MSSPAELIAALDAALADTGEDVILRRREGDPLANKDVTVRAHIRGLRADEIIGSVTQAYSKAILSMTQINAGWGVTVTSGGVDELIPRPNDFLVVKGKQRQIMFSNPIAVDGTVVRVELTVAG